MTEMWRPVVGFEEFYEVSNHGQIRSKDRYDSLGRFREGCKLKQASQTNGYLFVTLYVKGIQKHCMVHRVVAEAFVCNPNGFPCVNHIDEDKTNNDVTNLEWVTYKQNINHGTLQERLRAYHKTFSKPVIATAKDGTETRFASQMEAERITGTYHSNIAKCCLGKTRTAGGYTWRYA